MSRRFGVELRTLATLDVDEVAMLIVAYLRREASNGRLPHAGNALNDARIEAHEDGLTDDEARAAGTSVAAGWQWLRNHLMLVPHSEQSDPWEMLTPAAERIDIPAYLIEIRADDLLGGLNLDPELAADAMPSFRRGALLDGRFGCVSPR